MNKGSRPLTGLPVAVTLLVGLTAAGCNRVAFEALDQAEVLQVVRDETDDVVVPEGFRAVIVAEGFNYPSSIAWDDRGRMYVLESHSVAIPGLEPRIYRVTGNPIEHVALTGPEAPSGAVAVGLTFRDGWLYLSHEQEDGSWAISRLRPDGGDVEAVLRGLPPLGDHWINYLVHDAAGNLYFGVGSATNAGVVSSQDPVNDKWLEKRPTVADLPCSELVLHDVRFEDENALSDDEEDRAVTGAYQPYGQAGARRVPAAPFCTGSIYRLAPGASAPELVAWGFRNPVALAFTAAGELLVGMHGADIRSTRPVRDDPDAIYRVRQGAWYGWPDFAADLAPITEARYQPPAEYLAPGHDGIGFLIDHAASGLAAPDRSLLVAATKPHAALGGMDVVPEGGPFARWAGSLLISEMGDFRPLTDPITADDRAGFQVEVVDLASGRRETFARNRGDGPARPASELELARGFERPVDVKIGPDGLVYVLDFGVFDATADAGRVLPKTGKVFRIEPRPGGGAAP
jgi:glucose/arabinose dehydrogenase